ncbi:hypothetical protein ACIBEJ_52145, partial [Nonomuraea sp. NPDC050790]|uniref:hypothetical protein n=1 Tax=Nonomuraea sp. NPDC050790 TaxID=3364371 RepID=UPI00378C1D62
MRKLLAIAVTSAFFLPLYLVVTNVFKPGPQITADPAALPIPPTLDNLTQALTRPDGLFWNGLINSITVTLLSITVLTVVS